MHGRVEGRERVGEGGGGNGEALLLEERESVCVC